MNRKDILKFHTSSISPRLKFIAHLVFDLLLGLRVEYCLDPEEFEKIKGPKVNYTPLKIHNSLHIMPNEFLFSREIKAEKPPIDQSNALPLLFPTDKGDLAFDPLSASFYIVSRYEEYKSDQVDEHQRFPAAASLQSELGILHLPIVQVWAQILKEALVKKFPSLQFRPQEYSFLPTFDIDMAWSYKEKGWYRTLGAGLKSLIQFDLKNLQKRWNTINQKVHDPFDTFQYIDGQLEKLDLKPIYFFLVARRSQYDKNISPENTNFIKLIQSIAKENKVGLHPSYFSEKYFENELNTLTHILQKPVDQSRQHYLRLNLPKTYRKLIANNIKTDYSMGYPDRLGFRNGLAIPSQWYDLEQEKISPLVIYPFQVMDVTLKNYLKLSPENALLETCKIIDTIKKYGGTFIPIWHNSSFDTQWDGWKKVFEEMLSYAYKP